MRRGQLYEVSQRTINRRPRLGTTSAPTVRCCGQAVELDDELGNFVLYRTTATGERGEPRHSVARG